MNRPRRLAAALWVGVSLTHAAAGLSPMSSYHDLVAGAGEAGFLDGDFYRARFHAPAGLAFVERRAALFVSDRDNHRIRAIWLNENNRVTVLAGTGEKGNRDGTFELATFDGPAAMVAVSDRLLIVNDEGNAVFRALDLEKRSVTTLAGNFGRGVAEGAATEIPLGNVFSLLFVPTQNAIYFSQPEFHALRRLDLKSKTVSTVVKDDSRLPNPTALALFEGTLCVADSSGRVFRLSIPSRSDPRAAPALAEAWKGEKILALGAWENRLYALQAERNPAWTCLSTGRDVSFPSVWGLPVNGAYLRFGPREEVAFVADPRGPRSFFVTSTSLNAVLHLKDYRFSELSSPTAANEAGLMDYDYPLEKPSGTFRILILGDSRLYQFGGTDVATNPPAEHFPERVDTIPKSLELALNTTAALEGYDVRYEVLALTRTSWEPLLLWPNYEMADVVKKFDVDLVLLMLPPSTNTVGAYLQRPMTSEGIPASAIDPEYLLKPHAEKMRNNPAASLVQRCRELGWAHPYEGDQVYLEEFRVLLTDAVTRQKLLELFGTLLRGIRRRLEALRRGKEAKPPAFVVCNFPMGGRGSGVLEQGFWRDLCSREGVTRLDLVDPLVVLKESWYPVLESGESYGHFFVRGHRLFASVLAHELAKGGLIPLPHNVAEKPAAKRAPIVEDVAAALGILAVLAATGLLLTRRPRRAGSGADS